MPQGLKKRRPKWCVRAVPPVRLADLKPVAGMRVVDGLVVKEYIQGAWKVLGEVTRHSIHHYPVVID